MTESTTRKLGQDQRWPWLMAGIAFLLSLALQLPFASDRTDRPFDEAISGDCAASIQRHWLENGFFAMRGRPVKDWDIYAKEAPGPTYLRHPPLAQWLIFLGVKAYGYTPFGLRFCAILAAALSAALLAWISARRLGVWAAVATTCLWLSSPLVFFYGRMANTESFVFCFGLAGLIAMGRDDRRIWCLGLIALAAAALADWAGFLFYPGALFILWRRQSSWQAMVLLTVSGCVTLALLFGLLVWWSGGQSLAEILGDGLEKSQQYEGSLTFWDAQQNHLSNMYGYLPALVTGVALLAALWQLTRRRETEIQRLILSSALPGIGHVALFQGRAWDHEFWSYYLIGSVALASANLVQCLSRRHAIYAVLGLVLISMEGPAVIALRRHVSTITPHQSLAEALNQEFGPETLIVARHEVGGLLMHGNARFMDHVLDPMIVERLLEDFWAGKLPFDQLALWLDRDLAQLRSTLIGLGQARGGQLTDLQGNEFMVFKR